MRKKLVDSLKGAGKVESKPPLAVAEAVTDDETESKGAAAAAASSVVVVPGSGTGPVATPSSSSSEPIRYIDGSSSADPESETSELPMKKVEDEVEEVGSGASSATMSPATPNSNASSKSANSSKSLVSKRKSSKKPPALVPPASSNGTTASVELLGDGKYNIRAAGTGSTIQASDV